MSDNNDSPLGPKNSKSLSKIKSSLFERSLSVAKIGLNAGFKYAAQKVSSQNDPQKFNEFLTSQAQFITAELGELKGSLMKAGQMLSMYGEYFFPPEANQFLKLLQTDSPPLEFSEIQKILENYLSPEIL